ncbi:MAG: hypothetical protein QOG21_1879, partial [Actinomycetota bacterium]|nr:hypothetical protein [Actinomycetota bacterium]
MSPQDKPDFGVARFAPPAKLKEVMTSLARSARSICGRRAKVRVFLAGGADEALIPAVSESSEGLRKASTARSVGRAEGKPLRVDLEGASELAVAVLPLVSRGEVLGVLEVVASPAAISSGWKGMKAIADQGGATLRALEEAASLRAQLGLSETLSRLAHSLVRARSSDKAVDEVAKFYFETFGAPAVAWAVKADLTRLNLLSRYGLSAAASDRIQAELRSIRRLSSGGSQAKTQLVDSVASWTSVDKATVIDARDAVIVVGDESPEIASTVRFIQPMLKDVLHRLGILAQADLRHERLDLGISWTAH